MVLIKIVFSAPLVILLSTQQRFKIQLIFLSPMLQDSRSNPICYSNHLLLR